MAKKLYALTEKERAEILALIEEDKRKVRRIRSILPADDNSVPEVYIARTPVNGIPALVEAPGTGTGSELEDLPGFAECDIYRIVASEDFGTGTSTDDYKLVPVPHLSRRVFNLSTGAVQGERWVPVVRDKWGSWLVFVNTPLACDSVSVQETDFRCEEGVLNLYHRNVDIEFGADGCLEKTNGEWRFVRALVASCIEEDAEPGTGTGTGTVPMNPAYHITVILDFPGGAPFPDHDLYAWNDTDGGVCYFGNLPLGGGGFLLNHDVYPLCAVGPPDPPEIIQGDFFDYKNFRFARNQYSNCAAPAPVFIESASVTNIGTGAFRVNGTLVNVGDTWTVNGIFDIGYNTGDQHLFVGGTSVSVTPP